MPSDIDFSLRMAKNKDYSSFAKYLGTKPVKFNYLVWKPNKYKIKLYNFIISLPFGKKWKSYWFVKRCNYWNKPLYEGLKKLLKEKKKN